jgi:TolA-binding protein
VSQGESWSSSGSQVGSAPCARPAVEPIPPEAASAEPEAQPAEPRAPDRSRAGSPRELGKGVLAAQNRLYQEALDARNAHDDARAVALLGELLTKYPESPLRQEAQVERLRALKRQGELGEAARSARRYLAEHARGFARDEALELIWGPEPAKPSGSEP